MNVNILRAVDKYIFPFVIGTEKVLKLFDWRQVNISKKVLFIRLWGIGDAVCTLPTLERLHQQGFQVDVLTTNELDFVYNNQPFINSVKIFNYKKPTSIFQLIKELNNEKYFAVLDSEQFMNMSTIIGLTLKPKKYIGYSHKFRGLMYNKRVYYVESMHFVHNFISLLEPLGIEYFPFDLPKIQYVETNKEIQQLPKKLIGIHMGSGGTALGRRWDNYKFLELSIAISELYPEHTIIFTGVKEELNLYTQIKDNLDGVKHINYIGCTTKNDFLHLLTKLDLFICNDTGSMHLSAAMRTRTIGLFGMNHPAKVGPFPLGRHNWVYKNPQNFDIINNKYSIYPKDKYSTIDLISVENVLTEVQKCI